MKRLSAVGLVLTVNLKRLIFLINQIFYCKLQRNDIESGDIPNELALDRDFIGKNACPNNIYTGPSFHARNKSCNEEVFQKLSEI